MRIFLKLLIVALVLFLFAGAKDKLYSQEANPPSRRSLVRNRPAQSPERNTRLLQKPTKTLSRAFAHYIRGLLYDNENKLKKAIVQYRRAAALDYTVAAIHKKLAIAYIKLGQYRQAEDELKLVKKLAPEDSSIRMLLANFYTAQKKFEQAAAEYEQLLEINPDDFETLASLADLYVIQEKLEEAISVYQKILKTKTDSAQAYFNLAIIFTRINKLNQAEENFKQALELDPEYLQAELALALLNELKQDFGRAIEHYQKALQIDPLNISVYQRLAQTYYSNKRIEEAIGQYEFILKLSPHNIDAYLGLAYIYLNEKNPDKCIAILQEAIGHKTSWQEATPELEKDEDAKEAQVYLLLGLAYLENKQHQEAIQAYQKVIAINPQSSLGYFYLGALYEQTDRRPEAYVALRQSVELDDKNSDALNYLGYMYAEDEINLNQAQELIEKALEIDPNNGAYVDSLGWIHFKKGNIDQALSEIKRASGLLEDPEIFEHLGDIYRSRGELNKAKGAWEKALELKPERTSVQEKLKQLK